jgi:hypothetical protein
MSEIPKYTLVEKEDLDYYGFKIQEGEYKDVVYYYGEVKIEEDVENDKAVLNFNYQIDKGNKKYSIEQLQDSIKFSNLMGDILAEVLDKDNDERLTDDNSQ